MGYTGSIHILYDSENRFTSLEESRNVGLAKLVSVSRTEFACCVLDAVLSELCVVMHDRARALVYAAKKAPLEGPRYRISPVAFRASIPISAA
jgi:hypothetical protein